MTVDHVSTLLRIVSGFFYFYLLFYSSYLFLSVTRGAWRLYHQNKMRSIKNVLKHDYYFPVSILVPAYNEEVTIIASIKSLIDLDYKLFEIIVIDDGSKDRTSEILIEYFDMKEITIPIRKILPCRDVVATYKAMINKKPLILIKKENGGKGDALNLGINTSQYPYFLCIDADSMLQKDSLERIVQPVLEDDDVVAVGGLIRVAQCVSMVDGMVKEYRFPWNPLVAMQVVEYDRSFLASKLLMDDFNGNLIISGAFGLFKKDVAISAGGYDSSTLGEDMELVVKLHIFCRNNQMKYKIRYEANAICWSQVPSSLQDLRKQRRRWHIGLYQSMIKYKVMLFNPRFGLVGAISYIYFLMYELLSPYIELLGVLSMIIAWRFGFLDTVFMLRFYLLYTFFGAVLTITVFVQRIYTQKLKISALDLFKAVLMCFIENLFFRFFLDFVRVTAFWRYGKRKEQWGEIKRSSQG